MKTSDKDTAEPRPASRAGQSIIFMSGMVCATLMTLAMTVLSGILRPFFIAIFLCFLVKPLTARLGRRAGIFGYAFAVAVVFGVFAVGDRVVSSDLRDFSKNRQEVYQPRVKSYQEDLEHFFKDHQWAGLAIGISPRDSDKTMPADEVEKPDDLFFPQEMIDALPDVIGRVVGSGASLFLGVLGEAIVIIICMLLILLETDRLPGRLRKVLGEESGNHVLAVFADVTKSIQHYVWLKVLISLLTAVASGVVMYFFELHYVVTFAIAIFLLNFVPYLGSVIATILPCIIGFLQFESPWQVLWLAIALISIQQVIGNLIEPRIQGKGLSVSPVVIILALGFWGWLWGIGGMVLAVPITVTIRIILEQFATTKKIAGMMSAD